MMAKLGLMSQTCNFNYSTHIPSDLILQKFMLGWYVFPTWGEGFVEIVFSGMSSVTHRSMRLGYTVRSPSRRVSFTGSSKVTSCGFWQKRLRLTFPRAKLRWQIFMAGRNSGRRIGRNFGRNIWTKCSRASFAVENNPPNLLPKFLPIYHSMSCHRSCDWNLKISSPRASGAWGAQEKVTVVRPPGVDLEVGPTALQQP